MTGATHPDRLPPPRHALSVRAPWWWAILHLGKDIDNRKWPALSPMLRFRGRVWLHASAWWHERETPIEFQAVCRIAGDARVDAAMEEFGSFARIKKQSAIVGSIEVVDVVTKSDSQWFFGPKGLVLRNPVALAMPVPCKGALGYFEVPPVVLAELPDPAATLAHSIQIPEIIA